MSPLHHPGADPACPRCQGLGLQVVRDHLFAKAIPCGCVKVPCPACAGTGFVDTGEGFRSPVRACSCRLVASRAGRFDAMQVPGRYASATLDSYNSKRSGYTALPTMKAWVDKFVPGEMNRGVIMFGDVGVGKTHLAIAAARELIFRHGVSARFVEFSHLLADLKVSFDRRGGTAELLDPLTQVDILVIDELGKGRNTEFEGTVLDEIVSRRYNAGAAILGTTNYDPLISTGVAVPNAADRNAVKPGLSDRIGERVFSRLSEICARLLVEGEDYRTATKEAHTASTRFRRT